MVFISKICDHKAQYLVVFECSDATYEIIQAAFLAAGVKLLANFRLINARIIAHGEIHAIKDGAKSERRGRGDRVWNFREAYCREEWRKVGREGETRCHTEKKNPRLRQSRIKPKLWDVCYPKKNPRSCFADYCFLPTSIILLLLDPYTELLKNFTRLWAIASRSKLLLFRDCITHRDFSYPANFKLTEATANTDGLKISNFSAYTRLCFSKTFVLCTGRHNHRRYKRLPTYTILSKIALF